MGLDKLELKRCMVLVHERLWLKLWARGDCNCAIFLRGEAPMENSTITVTEGP